jgi:hypothetical protein
VHLWRFRTLMATGRRRRTTLVGLLAGVLLSAIILLISGTVGIGLMLFFLLAVGIDVILLRRREVSISEIRMAASFNAPRVGR